MLAALAARAAQAETGIAEKEGLERDKKNKEEKVPPSLSRARFSLSRSRSLFFGVGCEKISAFTHGGPHPFHLKSTCLPESTLQPEVVQIRARYVRYIKQTNPRSAPCGNSHFVSAGQAKARAKEKKIQEVPLHSPRP